MNKQKETKKIKQKQKQSIQICVQLNLLTTPSPQLPGRAARGWRKRRRVPGYLPGVDQGRPLEVLPDGQVQAASQNLRHHQ